MTNDCPFRDVCAEHLPGDLADGDCYHPEAECPSYRGFVAVHNAALERAIEKVFGPEDDSDQRIMQESILDSLKIQVSE